MCRSELPTPSSVLTRYALLARRTRQSHAQEPGFPPTFQEREREKERERRVASWRHCSAATATITESILAISIGIILTELHPIRASDPQRPLRPRLSFPSTVRNHTPKKLHLRARGAIKNLTQNAA